MDMKIKKYVVSTIPEAMEKIRNELGENAYILDTKRISKGGFLGIGGKKYIEVTAVLDEEPEDVIKNIKRPSGFSNNSQGKINEIREIVENNKKLDERIKRMKKSDSFDQYAPGKDKLELSAKNDILKLIEEQREISKLMDKDAEKFYDNNDFNEIKYKKVLYNNSHNNNLNKINSNNKNTNEDLKEIKDLIEKLSKRIALNGSNPLISELIESFKKQDLSDNLIENILNNLPHNVNKENWKSDNTFKNILFDIFRNNINIDVPNIHGTVMLIGPTGVGKTTTLAKLAAINKSKKNSYCNYRFI
jgi:flagellar biosynthesis protein FlhF